MAFWNRKKPKDIKQKQLDSMKEDILILQEFIFSLNASMIELTERLEEIEDRFMSMNEYMLIVFPPTEKDKKAN